MSGYRYSVEKPTEIKLLILYITEQARTVCKKKQIERLWLTDFVMLNVSTNYFLFEATVGELIEDGYLFKEERDGKTFLSILKEGIDAISYFYTSLPKSVRDSVDKALISSLKEKKSEDEVSAQSLSYGGNVHIARLRLSEEEKPLLSLEVTMPDKNLAHKLSKAMRKNPGFIYRRVMEACNELIENDKDKTEP